MAAVSSREESSQHNDVKHLHDGKVHSEEEQTFTQQMKNGEKLRKSLNIGGDYILRATLRA
jgi:hypothetical protein